MLSIKQVFCTVFLLTLLLSAFTAMPASALTDCAPGPHTVTGSQNVNARAGASTSARILQTLAPGTAVNVTAQELGVIVGGNGIWCAIDLNGQTAYVHSAALVAGGSGAPAASGGEPSANPPAAGGEVYHVAGTSSINGRASASTSGRIVVAIPGHADVSVVGSENGTVVNGSATWFQVVYNGQTVYVHSSLVAAGSAQAPSQPAPEQPQQGQAPAAGLPVPQTGWWTLIPDATVYASCEGTETISFPSSELEFDPAYSDYIVPARDMSYLSFDDDIFTLQGADTYVGSFSFTSQINAQVYLNITSPTTMTGHTTWNFTIDNHPCSATVNVSLTKD